MSPRVFVTMNMGFDRYDPGVTKSRLASPTGFCSRARNRNDLMTGCVVICSRIKLSRLDPEKVGVAHGQSARSNHRLNLNCAIVRDGSMPLFELHFPVIPFPSRFSLPVIGRQQDSMHVPALRVRADLARAEQSHTHSETHECKWGPHVPLFRAAVAQAAAGSGRPRQPSPFNPSI